MNIVKIIHIATAFISITGFTVRGFWMLTDSQLLQKKLVKIIPHINDTILLVTAIILAIQIQQYPFTDSWLTAKLVALIVYIVLGTVALKRGKTKSIRTGAFVLAIVVFVYIISVAGTHDPLAGLF